MISGVTESLPSDADLHGAMRSLVLEALQEIINVPVIGEFSQLVQDFTVHVKNYFTSIEYEECECDILPELSETFYSIITSQKLTFPSVIRSAVLKGTNKLLNDNARCAQLKNLLRKCCADVKEEVITLFYGDFILQVSKKVLVFALKKMRGSTMESVQEERRKRSSDRIDSTDFLELVYYIGGAVLSGLIFKGQGYSDTSPVWRLYVDVLKERFLRNDNNACSDAVRMFTECKDRGGLTHMSDNAFNFFVFVFDLLMSLEGEKGSLPEDVVDVSILNNDVVICLWDELVAGSQLDEDQVVDLLVQFSNKCVRVVMKGIMKRRLNEQLKKSYSSMALRARLAY